MRHVRIRLARPKQGGFKGAAAAEEKGWGQGTKLQQPPGTNTNSVQVGR